MSNIRKHALGWFKKQLDDPNSQISQFLKRNQEYYPGGWPTYKKNTATSKYFLASEAYPRIPVWWLGVPIQKLPEETITLSLFFLVCQKKPGDVFDFHLLAIPKSFVRERLRNGKLAVLGSCISLELSTQETSYKGCKVNVFDDVCSTRRLGRGPWPFEQFLVPAEET